MSPSPPSPWDDRAVHRQARRQGLFAVGLTVAGLTVIAVALIEQATGPYPFRGPDIGFGLTMMGGLTVVATGVGLIYAASRLHRRWWTRDQGDPAGSDER